MLFTETAGDLISLGDNATLQNLYVFATPTELTGFGGPDARLTGDLNVVKASAGAGVVDTGLLGCALGQWASFEVALAESVVRLLDYVRSGGAWMSYDLTPGTF